MTYYLYILDFVTKMICVRKGDNNNLEEEEEINF